MKKPNNTITVVNTEGVKTVFEVLLSFENITTNRKYIVYTDHTQNLDGSMKVYASIYNPSTEPVLRPITSDAEWEYVERMLRAAKEDYLMNH